MKNWMTHWKISTLKTFKDMKGKAVNIFIIILSLISAATFAQDEEPELPQQDKKAKEKIRAAHAAYISERLGLTPSEAEKFWPVYREFAQKRQDLKHQLRDARKTGQPDQAILDLDLKIRQQQLDLEKDYSGRFQKIITPQKLMNLRQAEVDFRNLILQQIQQRQRRLERQQLNRERPERLQQRNN
jgi:hypothetical protein